MLDAIIVTVVVASAVGYLVWSLVPRKNRKPAPCAACPAWNNITRSSS